LPACPAIFAGLRSELLLLLAGCATSINQAPVEDRSGTRPSTGAPVVGATAASPASSAASAAALEAQARANAELASKPGYYQVKPGDTLIRIGLEQGHNWRDVARWNNIDNPNLIEVGQVLRVAPPRRRRGGGQPARGARRQDRRQAARRQARRRGTGRDAGGVPDAASPSPVASSAAPATTTRHPPAPAAAPAAAPPPAPPVASRELDDDITGAGPPQARWLTGFDEGRNKGMAIVGKAGDPVLAAADGRVVYAGSGLRGYGNLVIVKHNNTYLTAYAHNQVLLVKEDQAVRRGQRIAEMGSTDAERVQLHFEIRRQGKPIDPVRLLPPR
jgi:lipoprotein NlpD